MRGASLRGCCSRSSAPGCCCPAPTTTSRGPRTARPARAPTGRVRQRRERLRPRRAPAARPSRRPARLAQRHRRPPPATRPPRPRPRPRSQRRRAPRALPGRASKGRSTSRRPPDVAGGRRAGQGLQRMTWMLLMEQVQVASVDDRVVVLAFANEGKRRNSGPVGTRRSSGRRSSTCWASTGGSSGPRPRGRGPTPPAPARGGSRRPRHRAARAALGAVQPILALAAAPRRAQRRPVRLLSRARLEWQDDDEDVDPGLSGAQLVERELGGRVISDSGRLSRSGPEVASSSAPGLDGQASGSSPRRRARRSAAAIASAGLLTQALVPQPRGDPPADHVVSVVVDLHVVDAVDAEAGVGERRSARVANPCPARSECDPVADLQGTGSIRPISPNPPGDRVGRVDQGVVERGAVLPLGDCSARGRSSESRLLVIAVRRPRHPGPEVLLATRETDRGQSCGTSSRRQAAQCERTEAAGRRRRPPRPQDAVASASGRPDAPRSSFETMSCPPPTAGPGGIGAPVGSRVYEGVVQDLIDELGRLPGVGPKSAQRIAFHLLAADPADVRRLVHALTEVKDKVRFCRTAATSPRRSSAGSAATRAGTSPCICVVEEPKDVVAIERTREFRGRYHVLGGAISPIEGVGPDDLRVRELMTRLADGDGHRADPGHRPEPRGRGDRHLPRAAGQADGSARHPARQRAAGRWRPGVRRRGHARAGLRGKAVARCLTRAGVTPATVTADAMDARAGRLRAARSPAHVATLPRGRDRDRDGYGPADARSRS